MITSCLPQLTIDFSQTKNYHFVQLIIILVDTYYCLSWEIIYELFINGVSSGIVWNLMNETRNSRY